MSVRIGNKIIAAGGGSADGESIKNQNTSSSIEKTYDWTGTLQQAIDQNVRALHPDWKIFITDDIAGGESVYTKSEIDAALNNKANKATTLSGYGITNAYTKTESDDKFIATDRITNCITEIPQDIKLELSDGTLTLKAGSKVYVPNGQGVFDTVTTTSDLGHPAVTGNRTIIVYKMADSAGLNYQAVGTMSSGPTDSLAGTTWHIWYDTTNNLIKRYGEDVVTPSTGHSLPIAIVTVSNGVITSIDQVFNGFGYIGSTVFALPGVKGLIPDGRNEDGSLKNIETIIPSVKTRIFTDTVSDAIIDIDRNGNIGNISKNLYEYKESENIIFQTNTGSQRKTFYALSCSRTSGAVSNFTPKTAFHAVNYSDSEYIGHQAMPSDRYTNLTLGASGATFIAPADGYFSIQKQASGVSQYLSICKTPGNSYGIKSTADNTYTLRCFLPVPKGMTVEVTYNAGGATQEFRFIYANGSK